MLNSFIKYFIDFKLIIIQIGINKILKPIKNIDKPSIENIKLFQFIKIVFINIQFIFILSWKFSNFTFNTKNKMKYNNNINDQNNDILKIFLLFLSIKEILIIIINGIKNNIIRYIIYKKALKKPIKKN